MKHDEYTEQTAFIKWTKLALRKYPQLAKIYANHNTQKLNVMQALRWKLLGGRSGVPDVFLPVARQNYHGLYLEFKAPSEKPKTTRGKKGGLSDDQIKYIQDLKAENYFVSVCYSWEEAKNIVVNYLEEKINEI